MGRGRQKAKQTKVARELKYNPQNTDFDALQRELSEPPGSHHRDLDDDDDEDDSAGWARSGS